MNYTILSCLFRLQEGLQQLQKGRNSRRSALTQCENTHTSGRQRFGLHLYNTAISQHGTGKFLYNTGNSQVCCCKIQQKIMGTQLKLGMQHNTMLCHTMIEKASGTGLALQQDERMLIEAVKGNGGAEFLCIMTSGHKTIVDGDLIVDAYGLANLKSLVRSFSFTDRTVTLTDKYDLTDDVDLTERLVTLEKPTLASDGKIEADGVVLAYDPAVCTVSIGEERVPTKVTDREEIIYTVDFALKKGVKTFVLTMTV